MSDESKPVENPDFTAADQKAADEARWERARLERSAPTTLTVPKSDARKIRGRYGP